MKRKKERKIRTFAQQLISTISVTLVLLLLGVVLSLAIVAGKEMRAVQQNVGLNVSVSEEATSEDIDNLKKNLENLSFVVSTSYMSPEEILEIEQKEIGEDIVQLLGGNPYLGEFDVKLKAEYANADSLKAVTTVIGLLNHVDSIDSRADTVDRVNETFSTLTLILSGVAIVLLLISFVLINNTVWLTIYSRRFLIHTMRLVGATPWFIRKPILVRNIVNGLIAGMLASVLLTAMRVYSPTYVSEISDMLPWPMMGGIYGVLMVAGMLICLIGAYLASSRYLRQNYDDLF